MPSFEVTTKDGKTHLVGTKFGSTVMEAIRDAGVEDVFALCGGACSCATCHVYVDAELVNTLPAMKEVENELLDGSAHRKAGSRLSCQIQVTDVLDGRLVTIAEAD